MNTRYAEVKNKSTPFPRQDCKIDKKIKRWWWPTTSGGGGVGGCQSKDDIADRRGPGAPILNLPWKWYISLCDRLKMCLQYELYSCANMFWLTQVWERAEKEWKYSKTYYQVKPGRSWQIKPSHARPWQVRPGQVMPSHGRWSQVMPGQLQLPQVLPSKVLLCTGGGLLSLVNIKSNLPPLIHDTLVTGMARPWQVAPGRSWQVKPGHAITCLASPAMTIYQRSTAG